MRRVVGTVVGEYAVVDGILCQLGMQLAQVPVVVAAVKVIDTVGNVARLLNLGEERPGTDAVYPSGRDVEDISGMQVVETEHLFDGAFPDAAFVFVGINGL